MRDFALLIPDEGNARQECGSGDEPDGGQEREKFAKEHGRNYRRRGGKREQFKLRKNRV